MSSEQEATYIYVAQRGLGLPKVYRTLKDAQRGEDSYREFRRPKARWRVVRLNRREPAVAWVLEGLRDSNINIWKVALAGDNDA